MIALGIEVSGQYDGFITANIRAIKWLYYC